MNALVCDPRATLLPHCCCCYLLVASSIFILAANARAACYRNLLAQCGYCASVSSFSFSSCYCRCRLLCCRKLLQHLRASLMNNVAFLDSHRMHRGKHHPETTLILWSIPAQNTISLGQCTLRLESPLGGHKDSLIDEANGAPSAWRWAGSKMEKVQLLHGVYSVALKWNNYFQNVYNSF